MCTMYILYGVPYCYAVFRFIKLIWQGLAATLDTLPSENSLLTYCQSHVR